MHGKISVSKAKGFLKRRCSLHEGQHLRLASGFHTYTPEHTHQHVYKLLTVVVWQGLLVLVIMFLYALYSFARGIYIASVVRKHRDNFKLLTDWLMDAGALTLQEAEEAPSVLLTRSQCQTHGSWQSSLLPQAQGTGGSFH